MLDHFCVAAGAVGAVETGAAAAELVHCHGSTTDEVVLVLLTGPGVRTTRGGSDVEFSYSVRSTCTEAGIPPEA